MFFSGDLTSRKKVDLGGRSSKERDRKVLLEEARLERKRRSELRQQTSAAIKIQKCFRGRRAAELARSDVRKQFRLTFGDCCQNVDKHCFSSDSKFLRQLLFFFTASNNDDVSILVEACRFLLHFVQLSGNIVSLFAGMDYNANHSMVEIRVKKLVYFCLKAVHHNRDRLKSQLLMPAKNSSMPTVILLETAAALSNPDLPWVCKVVDHLVKRRVFSMFRGILLTGLHNAKTPAANASISSFEHFLILISSHPAQHPCNSSSYSSVDLQWSFSSQLLSVPFFWRHLPHFREVFFSKGLVKHYVHQLAFYLPSHVNFFPVVFHDLPGYACLLGNLLEAAGVALSEPNCTFTTAMDFVAVSTFLLEALPTLPPAGENHTKSEDAMDEDYKETLDMDLRRQISDAVDPRLLQNLVNTLFRCTSLTDNLDKNVQSREEVEAIGAICAFLHVTFSTLRIERIMTGLAYRTELVPALWNFIKRCQENQTWPVSKFTAHIPGDGLGWLLPLAVFCPVYKHMLMIIDSEEFYEQHKPLSIKDIKLLVVILKQALWQLLWIIPGNTPLSQRFVSDLSGHKKLTVDVIRDRARIVISELLSQLQDWNNRRSFTPASDFHAQEATSETFISQALLENTKAFEILKQAPFLVPFTSRVKIFTSQLAASRQTDGGHPAFTRHRFKIRRDHILEDAFNQLSRLSEDDLRGSIRVSFVNEFGVEEAGIDGGGIFKDFMENVTHAAFDVQYGLFKETVDHLLYPNPGSGLVHEQHLQFFEFLGSVLAKAMYEGILVDIPFATFFLSKLKQKHNYLHDLPSLDPELYHHLLFLKRYKGDISELELYFVIINNEYGENAEEELRPGGKNIRVTNDNVIQFIHLVANHRLNYQIRHQSQHFLRGFQKLIKKEWIEMFNENEIQLLISGSLESLDVDDLRSNAHYSGGYHADHPVIEMFWEVLKSFSMDHQKKFLKCIIWMGPTRDNYFFTLIESVSCKTGPHVYATAFAATFVTGCSRGPLLGFKYLEPKFCIQRTASLHLVDADLDRLPTSATCMNLLKLPPYNSKEQMQAKLMYAINADAGFDLS